MIVCLCQGTGVFCANIFGLSSGNFVPENPSVVYSAIACYFFIGTIYPLTQIYQHEADANDGVKTISLLLGTKGTFLFSGSMFLLATLFIYLSFQGVNTSITSGLFVLMMLPATIYFHLSGLFNLSKAVHMSTLKTQWSC